MRKISLQNLPANATMAHIMVELGIFPSLTQARKNNWDKPITLGEHVLTKNKVLVEIVDEPVAKVEKTRDDLMPGFWPNYEEPKTLLSRAIQMPLGPNWEGGVINAYLKMEGII